MNLNELKVGMYLEGITNKDRVIWEITGFNHFHHIVTFQQWVNGIFQGPNKEFVSNLYDYVHEINLDEEEIAMLQLSALG